ncbi:MAG: hypothetical protein Q7S47_01090, partial [bacterium]|nr:hypothetical protein [bacterium]
KKNNLQNIYECLKNETNEVNVKEKVRIKAKRALDRIARWSSGINISLRISHKNTVWLFEGWVLLNLPFCLMRASLSASTKFTNLSRMTSCAGRFFWFSLMASS